MISCADVWTWQTSLEKVSCIFNVGAIFLGHKLWDTHQPRSVGRKKECFVISQTLTPTAQSDLRTVPALPTGIFHGLFCIGSSFACTICMEVYVLTYLLNKTFVTFTFATISPEIGHLSLAKVATLVRAGTSYSAASLSLHLTEFTWCVAPLKFAAS